MAGGYGEEQGTGRAVAAALAANHAARPLRSPIKLSRGGLTPARLRRVLDRIEAGLPSPLPLASLAAEAGMSPFHFAREFQRAVGVPPHQYLIRRRLDRAVLLLARRNMPLADVARAAGFAHVSHLARQMRRLTGLSPARFRTDVLP